MQRKANCTHVYNSQCERLQGFDDDYTLLPTFRRRQRETGSEALELHRYYCQTASGRAAVEFHHGRVSATPDGPWYKALGNSMPVPVIRWILERVAAVNELDRAAQASHGTAEGDIMPDESEVSNNSARQRQT